MTGPDITRLRERNGWTQSELADAINAALGKKYGSGSVSPWETGKRPIPADVGAFLTELTVATGLPPSAADPAPLGGEDDETAADTPPGPRGPLPQPELHAGSDVWEKACTELWEMIASGVGMVGAVTGSPALMRDGEIIAADKDALGEAWGKLARTNETFRKMLVGMTEGGAWLQVALVTGTTVSRCYQSHAQYGLATRPPDDDDGLSSVPAAA